MTDRDAASGTSAIDPSVVAADARRVLDDAWRMPGFCVPHPTVYPHQWLWDSCFHAIAWATLGEADRGVVELSHALGLGADRDDPAAASPDGFVPHMRYWNDPDAATAFWGTRGRSIITQPPMFGHAVRVLAEAGVEASGELVDSALAAFEFLLLRRRPFRDGRVAVVHPWETGCDDSPRWDQHSGRFDVDAWRRTKAHLVGEVVLERGAPVTSSWRRASIGFNSLVAWNLRELVRATGVDLGAPLTERLEEIEAGVAARWRPEAGIWTDHDGPGGSVITADAALGLLVDDRSELRERLGDPTRLGGPFGPAGVDREAACFDPDRYWRGPVWPQLGYLLSEAAAVCGDQPLAVALAQGTVRGATVSGHSEYWHPATGAARGATPQTWATIGVALLGRVQPD